LCRHSFRRFARYARCRRRRADDLLLRREEASLLAGSVGLFRILAVVMFITRRMNWTLGAEAQR
jgi:hypothetical protein